MRALLLFLLISSVAPKFGFGQFQIQDIETSKVIDSSSLTHFREITFAHSLFIYAIVKFNGAAVHQTDARANFEFSGPITGNVPKSGEQFLNVCFDQIKTIWRDSIGLGRHYISISIDSSGSYLDSRILKASSSAQKLNLLFINTVLHEAVFKQINMRYDEVLLVVDRSDELTSERTIIRNLDFQQDEEPEAFDIENKKRKLFNCKKKRDEGY